MPAIKIRDEQRIKNLDKLGTRTIEVMEYGSGGYKKKRIRRMVYSEKTLTPYYRIYWIKLYKDGWVSTSLEGIKHGIVAYEEDYKRIR